MSETPWTPGPWTACFTRSGGCRGPAMAFEIVARPMGSVESLVVCPATWAMFKERNVEFEANAHLIAAAPELYAALEEAHAALQALTPQAIGGVPQYAIIAMCKANAAMAKARGEKVSQP